jgi:sugar phosphate permease
MMMNETGGLRDELNPYDFDDFKTTGKTGFFETTHDFAKHRVMHRPFGKFRRKIIFLLIFFVNVLINFDHGAIPAATTIMKRDLDLDNIALGTIGSLVYLGLVLGAISAGPIFNIYGSKWIVILSVLVSCFFLYFFTIVTNVIWLALCRTGCGFFQVSKRLFMLFK